MKISELSRCAHTSVATIKYYLREGLLPPGEQRGTNQADYSEVHVRRLQLIRTLREIGRLGIGSIRQIVTQIDADQPVTYETLGATVDALAMPLAPLTDGDADEGRDPPEAIARATADVDRFLIEQGYAVRPHATARRELIAALLSIRRHQGDTVPAEAFAAYADLTRTLAAHEVAHIRNELVGSPGGALEAVVMGTVLWEPVILALRRLAHEALSKDVMSKPD